MHKILVGSITTGEQKKKKKSYRTEYMLWDSRVTWVVVHPGLLRHVFAARLKATGDLPELPLCCWSG